MMPTVILQKFISRMVSSYIDFIIIDYELPNFPL